MQIETRREFLRRGKACAKALILIWSAPLTVSCTSSSFVKEQTYDDGRIARLTLPQGQDKTEIGNFSLILPAGYLQKLQVTQEMVNRGKFAVFLGLELLDPSTVRLLGRIQTATIPLEEWATRGPAGNLSEPHTYSVEWTKKGVSQLLWDNRIINPPSIPNQNPDIKKV